MRLVGDSSFSCVPVQCDVNCSSAITSHFLLKLSRPHSVSDFKFLVKKKNTTTSYYHAKTHTAEENYKEKHFFQKEKALGMSRLAHSSLCNRFHKMQFKRNRNSLIQLLNNPANDAEIAIA